MDPKQIAIDALGEKQADIFDDVFRKVDSANTTLATGKLSKIGPQAISMASMKLAEAQFWLRWGMERQYQEFLTRKSSANDEK